MYGFNCSSSEGGDLMFPPSLSHTPSYHFLHFQDRGGEDFKGDGSIDTQQIKGSGKRYHPSSSFSNFTCPSKLWNE